MKKILLVFVIGVFLFGADYGRINGRVVDAETGGPLIGADVIIEGTELGAATDANGEFVVLYVPAGTYKLTASYI
ncbi:carboxypeptidase-like regulatory domain-containing protein, partial [candidate division WOR-3 bacterium]|nr:carboxypeptidase-like regulatory domain-containing protein [candidate division WOR-3 bacterium]